MAGDFDSALGAGVFGDVTRPFWIAPFPSLDVGRVFISVMFITISPPDGRPGVGVPGVG